jgi:hypothetical protein
VGCRTGVDAAGNQTRAVQPVAHLYTDRDIPALYVGTSDPNMYQRSTQALHSRQGNGHQEGPSRLTLYPNSHLKYHKPCTPLEGLSPRRGERA